MRLHRSVGILIGVHLILILETGVACAGIIEVTPLLLRHLASTHASACSHQAASELRDGIVQDAVLTVVLLSEVVEYGIVAGAGGTAAAATACVVDAARVVAATPTGLLPHTIVLKLLLLLSELLVGRHGHGISCLLLLAPILLTVIVWLYVQVFGEFYAHALFG